MKPTICALFLSMSLTGFAANATTNTNVKPFSHTERHHRLIDAPDKINRLVSNSFKEDFSHAEILDCEVSRNIAKVTFMSNDLIMHAFYATNGDLLGVTRDILTSELPMDLLFKFRQDYKDFWVTDLFEVTCKGESTYFITLENAGTQIVLKSTDDSNWETYTTINKD
jgi:hypothetical protein